MRNDRVQPPIAHGSHSWFREVANQACRKCGRHRSVTASGIAVADQAIDLVPVFASLDGGGGELHRIGEPAERCTVRGDRLGHDVDSGYRHGPRHRLPRHLVRLDRERRMHERKPRDHRDQIIRTREAMPLLAGTSCEQRQEGQGSELTSQPEPPLLPMSGATSQPRDDARPDMGRRSQCGRH